MLPDRHAAVLEVNVLPAQPEEFTASHPVCAANRHSAKLGSDSDRARKVLSSSAEVAIFKYRKYQKEGGSDIRRWKQRSRSTATRSGSTATS